MEKGVLIPLKTTSELAARDRVVDVWIVAVKVRKACGTLSLIPGDSSSSFQHLKRCAKLEEVPERVRRAFTGAEKASLLERCTEPHENEIPTTSEQDEQSSASNRFTSSAIEEGQLLLVVCPVHTLPLSTLMTAFSTPDSSPPPNIISTSVPLLAPTSAAQASRWTETHWPTIYKKNNPFGPHPSIVSRAQAEIEHEVGKWMALARAVATDSGGCKENLVKGEAIGVVIVERKQGIGKAIAVARDARWAGWEKEKTRGGNPTAHAVMRAIALVATSVRGRNLDKKRKNAEARLDYDYSGELLDSHEFEESITAESQQAMDAEYKKEISPTTENLSPARGKAGKNTCCDLAPAIPENSIFHDRPLSQIEAQYHDPLGNDSGYLCHNLEIYSTHEPCVMCSMAIVHSRFGRIIFEKQMFRTGGLSADGILGHGLFWRKELNWTMLAWKWNPTLPDVATSEAPDLEA